MLCIRVGRRHTFYRALDLLTACACTDLSAGASTSALPNAVRLSRPALDSTLCRLGMAMLKLLRPPLLSLGHGLRHFRRSFTVLSATAPSSSRLRAHPSCWFTHAGRADGRPRTPGRIPSEDHIISQRFSPPSTGCISGGHTSLSLYW